MAKSVMKKQGLISLTLALCLLLSFSLPVFAGLRVAGAKIEATVASGSETTYKMNVADTSNAPMDIAIEVKGYGDTHSQVNILDPEEDNSPYTARDFLSVSPNRFQLEPGESQDVTVTASIPDEIGDGGRYAIIYIRTIPPEGSSFATAVAVAAVVLLTIEGSNLIKSGEISQIQLGEADSGQHLEISAMLKNTGNYHYRISATGNIKNERGKVVATSLPQPSQFPLVPTYSRQIEIPFGAKESLPPGKYQVEIDVTTDDGTPVAQETGVFQLGETWEPSSEGEPPSQEDLPAGRSINWALTGAIAGGIMVLAMAIYIVRRRRIYL